VIPENFLFQRGTIVLQFDLSETLARIVDECAQDGMALPFIVCAASPNGSVLVTRKMNASHTQVLAQHFENGGLKIPMSVMVLDQKNKAVRIVVDEDATITRH
jgi:hypothetical protein